MSALSLAPWLQAAVIAAAVAAGLGRLALIRRVSAAKARGPRWRFAALAVLTVMAGALLWLTLNPPPAATGGGVILKVATAGAPAVIAAGPGEELVALPEAGALPSALAGALAGATRAPDLATALRRRPEARAIRIEGDGLVPRDQGRLPAPLTFTPPPPPEGLVELTSPPPTAPGAAFAVAGRLGRLARGTVELVDPGGEVADRAPVTAGQAFALSGRSRAPGPALFRLRLRDGAGAVVEEAAVPVESRVATPPRVMVLAGAPHPDLRFLRRWAEDAGMALDLDIDLGAGTRLGGAALTPAALGRTDLVIVDERRWDSLDASSRRALAAATREGLGLLLRPMGPVSAATRRDWAGLGLPLTDGDAARPWIPPGVEAEAGGPEPEALSRFGVVDGAAGAVPLIQDREGRALAAWAPQGRGRVGVWTVADSYALALLGHGETHGALWSRLFGALARPAGARLPRLAQPAWAGERLTLCGLASESAEMESPGGDRRRLMIDPGAGAAACAAYWPDTAGWHWVQDGDGRETAVYVRPAGDAPSLRRMARRQATLDMAAPDMAAPPPAPASADQRNRPGSPWPWFAGLALVLGLLWWLERRRPRPKDEDQPPTA